ncbi:hypothetical protein [Halorussus sp. MSC15.2]|uniref:hypothetical protein n=1 Tax=Halorussus sp. MSC15.2 TaxID=2283638 RepID=UPI0013D725B0|nr:hypothetical protein [Halorussus sp. MSC15.2]NEU55790.1 hypothetical protein [Halorussus sp. MSC15.2]
MAGGVRAALALAVLLALAGATPAAADQTSGVEGAGIASDRVGPPGERAADGRLTDDESSDATVEIETEGFTPDYDPSAVLNRVERLRGLDATQGITLHEYDPENGERYDMRDTFGSIRPVGAKALQLYSNASTERRTPLGYTVQREAAVHIYLLNDSQLTEYGLTQDVVLAHEFVHALQFQHELLTPSRSQFRAQFPRWTTDSRLVTTAMVEGDAMWVTEQYVRRYGGGNYSVADYNRTLDRAAWPHSVAGTPYYYGYEFYERTGSSPAVRSAAIERPPDSTAELLHPTDRDERAPLPEAPEIPESEKLTQYHTDTVGELVVRHSLRMNGLAFDRAARVADGWANDRMYYYAAAGAAGPATHWVTVWESEREAGEFADAWRAMLDERGARSAGETLFVPASDHAPGVHYVVERDGATVRITAAGRADTAERLADGATETGEDGEYENEEDGDDRA